MLLVYLFHYGGGLRSPHALVRSFGYLTQGSWVGVHVFFTLSGFLITGILVDSLGRPHALRRFFVRRALRIYPVYFAAVLAAALAALLFGATAGELRPLLPYLAFLQNLPPFAAVAVQPPPPLPLYHLWTVAVEEQFYLLWPFLLLAARTPWRTALLCCFIFVLSCGFRAVVFAPHLLPGSLSGQMSGVPLTRIGGFALGGALAALRRLPSPVAVTKPLATCLGLGSLVWFLTVGWWAGSLLAVGSRNLILAMPAVDLGSAALLALALAPGALRSLLSVALLRWFGRISYGFYVLHLLLEPLYNLLGRLFTHSSTSTFYLLFRLGAALPLTALAAAVSYRFFELPFLRRKRSYE